MEWVEITAATVAEARERALDRLGVDVSDAEIEVVEEGGRSMFGLRRADARVRARVRPTAPPPRLDRQDRRRGSGRGAKRSGSQRDSRSAKGKDKAGGSSGDKGKDKAGGSSKGKGKDKAGGSSKGKGKDKAGGSSKGKGKDKATHARPGEKRSRTADVPQAASSDAAPGELDEVRPSTSTRRTRTLSAGPTVVERLDSAAGETTDTGEAGSGAATKRRRRLSEAPSGAEPSTQRPSGPKITRRRGVSASDSESLVPVDDVRDVAPISSGVDNSSNQEEMMSDDEMSPAQQGEMVVEFLDGLLESFGLTGSASVVASDDDSVDVGIDGDQLGLLIGPGGHTLSALTEVTKTVMQRQSNGASRARIRLDVAGYRERRRDALDAFTREVAETVKSTGEPRALEPMHSADRKVVHDTANDIDGVATTSDGDEPRRRVVIIPES